jgi:putative DNA primase/helicase
MTIPDQQQRFADLLANASSPQTLPSPSAPYEAATMFLEEKYYTASGERTLYRWRNTWMIWRTSHWQELTPAALRAQLYHYTARASYVKANGEQTGWAPTEKKISDLAGALASLCELPDTIDAPCWLDGRKTGVVIAVANGLLDVTSQQLHLHTPQFFNLHAVPFAYDAAAPLPRHWFAFLDSVWPPPRRRQWPPGENAHQPAQDLLQEWFGYVLSGRTDLQKMLLMYGPTRGGRGVTGRLLAGLLGKENVAGLRLDDLGENFGMAHLIGKPLAIVGDERFGGKGMTKVVSGLLSITGEDRIAVDRKHRDRWIGKLPTRIMIFANELQKLSDASGAIVGRFLMLRMTKSWLGREDIGLTDRLLGELPGILNWALDGLRFLIENGKFTVDPEAEEDVALMRALASPMQTYVEENCVVGEGKEFETYTQTLYHDYCAWRKANGHMTIASSTFGVALRAAFPHIGSKRCRRPDGSQFRVYVGIRLKAPSGGLLGDNVLPYRSRQERGETDDTSA